MFEGVESDEKDPTKSIHVDHVATPELAPDEAYVAVMASAINFNTVWTSIFEPLPTFGFLDRLGKESVWGARHAIRPAHHRLRRVRSRAPRRVGGAQLEAGRQGQRPLQPCRRSRPIGARRLDARRQSAHLGIRDQLRRAGRSRRSEGQPADAEGRPPVVGGERVQRALQLDVLPDDRQRSCRRSPPGRRRAHLGRHRRHRRLRRAVRPQRRRDPGRASCRRSTAPSCCGRWAARR